MEEQGWWNHTYATHMPFLERYIQDTSGDIIEFGTGFFSTGLIINLIKGTNRTLISVEDSKEWLDTVVKAFPSNEHHKYYYLDPKDDESHWDDFHKLFQNSRPISIVFIDQATWVARTKTFHAFLNRADYIIAHDADYFPLNGGLGKITNTSLAYSNEDKYDFSMYFKRYKLYFPPAPWNDDRRGPPTLVGTTRDLPIHTDYEAFNFE